MHCIFELVMGNQYSLKVETDGPVVFTKYTDIGF